MRRPGMHQGCSSGLPPKFQDDEKKKNLHFFQIIHNFIIQNRRLELPRKFIRKFGKELSAVAVVVVPSGKMWHLELRRAEGKISFQNGWQEFMDFYSICVGHFLVFRYDGNSRFHVLIFDMSASEIKYEYPCHTENFEEYNHERVSYKERYKSYAQSEDPSSDSEDDPETVLNSSDSESNDEPTMFTQLKSASSRGRGVRGCTKQMHNAPESSKMGFSAPRVNRRNEREQEASAKTPRKGKEFEAGKPSCTVIMRPSYVSEKFLLNVPVDLSKYLSYKTQNLTLRVPDGRMWRVVCVGKEYVKLSAGWKEFAVDNHLKKGDVCTFELVDDTNFEVEVSIFHASQGAV